MLRRIIFSIACALLTLDVTIVGFSSAGVYPRLKESVIEPIPAVPSVFQKKRHFKFVKRSCESGCLEVYESPSGQQVELVYACLSGSPAETPRAMRSLMEDGRLIETRWKNVRRGIRVERTVVAYPKIGPGVEAVEIYLYRPGDLCFWYISADSLKLALEFEQSDVAAMALFK